MADEKVLIKDLPSGTLQSNSDVFIFETNDVTKKIAYSDLASFILHTSLIGSSTVSITDITEQGGIKKYQVTSTSGTEWYFGNTQPVGADVNDYWLRTDVGHYGDVDQYDGTTWVNVGTFAGRDGQDGITPSIDGTTKHWMIGSTDTGVVAEGHDGATGATGAAGVDGASISASATPITGGHRLTISSTDPQTTDVTFDVMDGTEIIQTTSDTRTVTLTAAGWQGTTVPYSQTVSFTGMTSSVVPEIGVAISSVVETGLEQQKQWSYITRAESGTDTITFYCYKRKPTIDLQAIVKAV